MTRRRSRRLSGSPEYHNSVAQTELELAKREFRAAMKLVRKGDCGAAYPAITSAFMIAGAAASNVLNASAYGVPGQEEVRKISAKADTMFAKACVLSRRK